MGGVKAALGNEGILFSRGSSHTPLWMCAGRLGGAINAFAHAARRGERRYEDHCSNGLSCVSLSYFCSASAGRRSTSLLLHSRAVHRTPKPITPQERPMKSSMADFVYEVTRSRASLWSLRSCTRSARRCSCAMHLPPVCRSCAAHVPLTRRLHAVACVAALVADGSRSARSQKENDDAHAQSMLAFVAAAPLERGIWHRIVSTGVPKVSPPWGISIRGRFIGGRSMNGLAHGLRKERAPFNGPPAARRSGLGSTQLVCLSALTWRRNFAKLGQICSPN